MSNKGKKKCTSCGCFDDWKFVEEDGKKRKYYCSGICLRKAHIDNAIWGEQTCESCGMHMKHAIRAMFLYDYVNDKHLFFCREECYGYYLGILNEEHSDYRFIEERNRKFVKNKEG